MLVVLPVLPLVAWVERRTAASGLARRIGALTLAIALGTVIGVALRSLCVYAAVSRTVFDDNYSLFSYWMDRTFLCFALGAIYVLHTHAIAAAAAVHSEQLAQSRLDQQNAAASLQALQAQIEPHFLFNTLANVRRLIQSEPSAGRAMLHHLRHYLRTSLPTLRASRIALADELDLIEAYLRIQAVRMGARLRWDIDADAGTTDADVPPLMLVTLVENAIKHGLAPLPDGGSLRVAARVVEDCLQVQVSDDGCGFQASSGSGTGLANIRARLALLYGDAARLSLAANTPRGVVATITLPCRKVARA
jgi:LytS/YehU family sensor histidine kinase